MSNTTPGVSAVNAPTTTTIAVSSDTPSVVVSAINSANTGITASLIDTGIGSNSFKILLSGQSGVTEFLYFHLLLILDFMTRRTIFKQLRMPS